LLYIYVKLTSQDDRVDTFIKRIAEDQCLQDDEICIVFQGKEYRHTEKRTMREAKAFDRIDVTVTVRFLGGHFLS